LLDFSSIDAGRLRVELQRDTVADILESFLENMRALSHDRELALTIDADARALVVVCDRERVEQILSNLVGNAVKFTPAGGRVSVRLTRSERDAVVSVDDTGPGIAPEQLPRIFDELWQGRPSRDSYRDGVGLGPHIT